MKSLLVIITLFFTLSCADAQTFNWKNAHEASSQRAQIGVGYDYGFVAQFTYGRLVTLYQPMLLGVTVSLPMGSDVLDDFKVRIGSEVQLVESGGFAVSMRVATNFRRYQNASVRSVGFGADFAAIAGYYSDTWHAAGEFGFDKAISTNLLHTDLMRSNYPDIRDGWYVPTAGHFYYGVQGGVNVSEQVDLSLRLGQTRAQLQDKEASLPYYGAVAAGLSF